MKKQLPFYRIVLTTALFFLPLISTGQTVDEIVDGMQNSQNATEGIENYTVTQSTFIKSIPQALSTSTTYHERGESGFSAVNSAGGQNESTNKVASLVSLGTKSAKLYNQLRNKSNYRGTENINGERVYVLHTTDPTFFIGSDGEASEDDRFKLTEAFFYVGVDDFIRRGMRVKGELTDGSKTERVDIMYTMSDFKDVDGLYYSFLTTINITGMTLDAVTAQKDQAREALTALENKIRQAPRLTRGPLERRLKPEMNELRAKIADETITILLKVEELKVNAGRPSDG